MLQRVTASANRQHPNFKENEMSNPETIVIGDTEYVRGETIAQQSLVKDGMKYTVIYADSWMSGSHFKTQVKMRRTEQRDGETVEDMLKRENLVDCAVFLFHGHPMMQGEEPGLNANSKGE